MSNENSNADNRNMPNRFLNSEPSMQRSFDDICVDALRMLQEKMNFGLWMVTKVDGDDWIVMKSHDSAYGVQDGDVFVWMESFCSRMVRGLGPTFAPESDKVIAYAQAEIGRKIPIQAYIGFPLYREDGELLGTVCAIDQKPVPESWSEHQGFVEEIAAELSEVYRRDYKQALCSAKERAAKAEADDLLEVLLSHDWESLIDVHEDEARSKGIAYSIIVAKADISLRVDADLTNSLNKVIGRDNFVVYHGKGLYSMLLADCNAPKLDAFVDLIRTTFEALNVRFHVGYATRSDAHGLNHAYDQALGKVLAQELRNRAA